MPKYKVIATDSTEYHVLIEAKNRDVAIARAKVIPFDFWDRSDGKISIDDAVDIDKVLKRQERMLKLQNIFSVNGKG